MNAQLADTNENQCKRENLQQKYSTCCWFTLLLPSLNLHHHSLIRPKASVRFAVRVIGNQHFPAVPFLRQSPRLRCITEIAAFPAHWSLYRRKYFHPLPSAAHTSRQSGLPPVFSKRSASDNNGIWNPGLPAPPAH